MNIIAEILRGTPHGGILPQYRQSFDPVGIAQSYELSGADMLSVQVNPVFSGKCTWIKTIKKNTNLAIIARDFVNRRARVDYLKLLGADFITLHPRIMEEDVLSALVDYTFDCEMIPLIEVSNLQDIHKANQTKAGSLLINNTNWNNDCSVLNQTFLLYDSIPQRFHQTISSGGITTRDEVQRLQVLGVKSVIVGDILRKAKDLKQTITQFKHSGK